MDVSLNDLLVGAAALWRRIPIHDTQIPALNYKRSTSACSDGDYETSSTLNFEIQCNHSVSGFDYSDGPVETSDIYECMDECASHRPPCYAVTYSLDDQLCYLKTEDAQDATAAVNSTAHYALANATQLEPFSITCPDTDNAVLTTPNSMNFTLYCNKVLPYYDATLDGRSHANFHTDTLEECMEACSTGHPRCLGVAWNPDLKWGFENCYPKTSDDTSLLADSGVSAQFVAHTALAADALSDSSCQNTGSKSAGGKDFSVQCSRYVAGGQVLQTQHMSSLDSCLSGCATHKNDTTGDCVVALFDATWENGFENCVYKNNVGAADTTTNSAWVMASVVSSTSNATSNGTNTDSGNEQSSGQSTQSKAWVAGPVIGAVAVVGILAALILWRKRKQKKAFSPPQKSETDTTQRSELNTAQTSEFGTTQRSDFDQWHKVSGDEARAELDHVQPLSELPARPAELSAEPYEAPVRHTS